MNHSFSKSITSYNNLSNPPELSAPMKHNFSLNKPESLILLKNKENPPLDFTFKYMSEQHLAKVSKHVRRKRQQKQFEVEWKLFSENKQLEEEKQEQQQLLKNNTGIDISDSRLGLPELMVNNSDKIMRGETKTKYDEANYEKNCFNHETVVEKDNRNNLCKCTFSEINNIADFRHFRVDNGRFSEDSDVSKPAMEQVSMPLSIGVLNKMEDLVIHMNKIRTILSSDQNEFIDSDVAERNRKRLTEFTTLFARNYLYRIQRQKKEARKIFIGNFPLPQQKLAMMYQTALQALQVYEHHLLKSCIYKRCSQQLEQIFDFIIYLTSLTEKVTGEDNFLHKHELVDGSKQLKWLLAEYVKDKVNIPSTVVKSTVNKLPKTKRKTRDNLSMYVSNQPKPFWKKTSAKLAKAKFGPPSAQKSCANKKEREVTKLKPSKNISKESVSKQEKVIFEECDNIPNVPSNTTETLKHNSSNESEYYEDQNSIPSEKICKNSNALWPKNIQMVCIEAEENDFIQVQTVEDDVSKRPPKQKLIVSDTDKEIALRFKSFVDSSATYIEGNKPWDIVSRISDEVTLDVLEDVCQELEIDVVIQKLYDLEFK